MNLPKSRITLSFTWHVFIVALLIILLTLSVIIFGGIKLYQKVLTTEKLQKDFFEIQDKERKMREAQAIQLLDAQAKELTETRAELEKTKTTAQKTTAEIKSLSETISAQSKTPKETVITSTDLASYVTGVVQVLCLSPEGIVSGSGSLSTFKEVTNAVLTNYHVVKNATRCVVIMTNSANSQTGLFSLKAAVYSYNTNTDQAILDIGTSLSHISVPIENYNYSFSSIKKCTSPMAVGTPVVIIGFPAYAKRDSLIEVPTIGTVHTVFRTTTNGIISGYDTSMPGSPNYFVSAKIDNGNSGGAALAKDQNGLCLLGLPTWLTVGNYETQGLVQNIMNVLPSK